MRDTELHRFHWSLDQFTAITAITINLSPSSRQPSEILNQSDKINQNHISRVAAILTLG